MTAPRTLRAACGALAAGALATLWSFGASRQPGSRLELAPLADLRQRGVNQRRIRSRCLVVPISDRLALCRVLGRFKMYVDPQDHGLAVHLMLDGYWEMWVTQVIASLVQPGMVAIDVGANQGYYTLLLADMVGRRGRVLAFEPNTAMAGLLRRSVAANGFEHRVTVHAEAAGTGDATRVLLRVPENTPSGAHLEVSTAPEALGTVSLDAALGESPLHFVKIDAEGWELAVWRGMRAILARGAPLIVAFEFVQTRMQGEAVAFLQEVQTLGFSLAHCHRSRGLVPITADEVLSAPQDQEFVLVLRRGL